MKKILSSIVLVLFLVVIVQADEEKTCSECLDGCSYSSYDGCNTTSCDVSCWVDEKSKEHWYMENCATTLVYCPMEISNPFENSHGLFTL